MGLSCSGVGSAGPFEGAGNNYESEGRTFESFRARHFFLLKSFVFQPFCWALAGAFSALVCSRFANSVAAAFSN